ncbi:DUF4258 domain-containing protein [Endozoicomonas gorgoniicola]|uniref:DUF4258 domain-containing protein n=1 Tax=Endozoicomonas gorgoniicola TaxID=1234144 RepID=A0ABT3N4F8_9GAMM|nr:DUF4258 domain-containing protein [Endozoicomonas gorgoniicola]MCW7556503.1 DUF4258 domain-containing protein [Endozoicomonas gorgoniicola]
MTNRTSKVVTLPFIKAGEVRQEIARIAKDESHNLDFLDHALLRMQEREVTTRQILNVLKNGEQIGDVTWCTDQEKGWRCRLSRVTAGVKITVVAKVVQRENTTCLVITTWEG